MKNIKLYEDFNKFDKVDDEAQHKGIYPKRKFDEFTSPSKPVKRKLTDEEREFLIRNFQEHSWSQIDNEDRIILGDGTSPKGMYYITEDDLKTFMEEERAHQ